MYVNLYFGDAEMSDLSIYRRLRPTLLTMALAPVALVACAQPDASDTETEETTAVASDAEAVTWSYSGETGPAEWATLSEEYAACAAGSEQSPIDIPGAGARSAELPAVGFDYAAASARIEDGGHGVLVTPETPLGLTVGDDRYSLLQFHAHDPSEHTIDGRSYPLEIHFVHQNEAGQLAVVGVMVEEGESDPAFGPVVEGLQADGSTATVEFAQLLPESRDYFTYDGSLTTPPCSEGVRWIVMAEPIEIGAEQMAALAASHEDSNRPVQPLEGRVVRSSS